MRTVLSIAGSDSSAGAGIQADLLTFSALGCYGTTAITAVTAQNPDEVAECELLNTGLITKQIRAIASYYDIKAIKTGLLSTAAIITELVKELKKIPNTPVVVDPVMVSTSGCKFLNDDAIAAYENLLFPLAKLITPNLDEAAVLLGASIHSVDEMKDCANVLSNKYGTPVLLKGGHLNSETLYDVLSVAGETISIFEVKKVHGINSHGSGCTLSAAITAYLGKGNNLVESVSLAKAYLEQSFLKPLNTDKGKFLNHLPIQADN